MTTEDSSPDHDEQVAAEVQAEEARRLQRVIEVDDLKWFMSTKQGRRVMWRLLEKTGVYRTSFITPNAMQVSFLEGRREIGLEWLGEIMEHCPEQFNTMTTEHQAHARRYSSASRSGNTKPR